MEDLGDIGDILHFLHIPNIPNILFVFNFCIATLHNTKRVCLNYRMPQLNLLKTTALMNSAIVRDGNLYHFLTSTSGHPIGFKHVRTEYLIT